MVQLKEKYIAVGIALVLVITGSYIFINKRNKRLAMVQKIQIESELTKQDLKALTEHYKDRVPLIQDIVETKKKLNVKASSPENIQVLETSLSETSRFMVEGKISASQIQGFDVLQSNISNLTAELITQLQLQPATQKLPTLIEKFRKLEREEQEILRDRAKYHEKVFQLRKLAKDYAIDSDTIAFPAEESLANQQLQ